MLNKLFSLFLKPFTVNNQKSGKKTPVKPLAFQTVYSTNPNHSKPINESYISIDPAVIEQQKNLLKERNTYSNIEQITLAKDSLVVGYTKHAQTLLRGVFMYPPKIETSQKWEKFKIQAEDENTDIATFRLKQATTCLALKNPDGDNEMEYLIDNRLLVPVNYLYQTSARTDLDDETCQATLSV